MTPRRGTRARVPRCGPSGRTGALLPPGRSCLVLALVVAAAGCSAGRAANPFDRAAGEDAIEVRVDNQNFNDVRVVAVTVGGRETLGSVGGRSTRSFTMSWPRLESIRFQLEFLAGGSYATPQLNAAPGDRLEVLIGTNPRNASVRRR